MKKTRTHFIRSLTVILGLVFFSPGCYPNNQSTGTINGSTGKKPVFQITASQPDAAQAATITVPSNLIELGGQLKIEEGAPVASGSLAAALNIVDGLSVAGPSVNISADAFTDISEIGQLEISLPYEQSETLALNGGFLVVVYQILGPDGKVLLGVIPASGYVLEQASVRFKLLGLGSYQAVRVVTEIKEEVVVKTEETKVFTKVEQEILPVHTVASISPIIAKKGETVSISGTNFRSGIRLAYLGRSLSQVEVKSDQLLTVVIDDAPRLGVGSIYLTQNGSERSLNLAYSGAASDYPLITLAATDVCAGQKFYNANGDLLEGSKSCQAVAVPTCSTDGQTGCVAVGPSFAAALLAGAESKILSTQTLAGITGNVTLPAVSNVRASATVNGVAGTLADCTTNAQTGCVTSTTYKSADLTNLSSSNILNSVTIAGVTGTVVASGAACSSDGQGNCSVDGTNYAAALLSGAASKIVSGQTLAGVPGSVTLPLSGKVLAGISYGSGGTALTGTLMLPSPSNVVTGSGLYGDPGAQSTPSYVADFPLASNVRSTDTVNGATGTLTDCAADGETLCVSSNSYPAVAVVGLSSKVITGQTVAGISGTGVSHPFCSAANISGCITTSTYKSMDLSSMGSGSAVGLTGSNFETRIANNGSSEFWDASGTRHTFTGDIDFFAGNIKSGTSIFSISGQYPSLSYPLSGDTATADLSLFTTQLTSDGTFEYFDSRGNRYTGSGDSDLLAANIRNSVSFENFSIVGDYRYTCPTGWIKVPGDADYGLNDFCVMKFEAKNSSATAVSIPSLTPWVSISQEASISTCRALGIGYDLIDNPQWMTIAAHAASLGTNWTNGTVGSGTIYQGHNDNIPASACVASSNDNDAFVESSCTPTSSGDTLDQKRTLSLSNSEVLWDLSGNVNEWVHYFNSADKPNPTAAFSEYTTVTATGHTPLKHLVPTNAVQTFWISTWNSTQGIGKYWAGTNGAGGALYRGGSYNSATSAGIFFAKLDSAPTAVLASNGYRCAYRPPNP